MRRGNRIFLTLDRSFRDEGVLNPVPSCWVQDDLVLVLHVPSGRVSLRSHDCLAGLYMRSLFMWEIQGVYLRLPSFGGLLPLSPEIEEQTARFCLARSESLGSMSSALFYSVIHSFRL
jgi:hypothetical protein